MRVEAALRSKSRPILPAPSHVECPIVLGRKQGEAGVAPLDPVLATRGIEVAPFASAHAALARDAFLRFGKGRHPAGPNFGDGMSDAVATAEGLPLLFVGEDFRRRDVRAA